MASSYAVRSTPAETFNKITVSCWLKSHADGTQRSFWGLYDNSSSDRFFHLYYSTNGSLYGYWKQNEGTFFTLGTMQKFRDPNAWFHFVMTMDTTRSTAADRVKFYLNGERITSFEDSLDTITQNQTCNLMNGTTDGRMQWGGGKQSGTQYYWNGSMSHCHMCVGYAYDATEFGETDSTSGIWKIKASPSVNYGTNGGWWFKDGSQLTDSSTNSNTLTSSGTLTNTEDNPSNNFATGNPIANGGGNLTFTNGNTTIYDTDSTWRSGFGGLAPSSGKWYFEVKHAGSSSNVWIGIMDSSQLDGTGAYKFMEKSRGYGYSAGGEKGNNNSTGAGWGASYAQNDIIGVAMDLDNNKIYFSKNGTWQDSGDPTSGATGTGSMYDLASGYNYFPATSLYSTTAGVSFNFGNGYFGTTAVASSNSDSAGLGLFEYSVPSGYYSICTKNIKNYG